MTKFCVEIEYRDDRPVFVDFGPAEPGSLAQENTEYSFFDNEQEAARMFQDMVTSHPGIRCNRHTSERASSIIK